MTEVWLPIPTYEGLYEVSNLGRVRSLDRICVPKSARQGAHVRRGKMLKLSVAKHKAYAGRVQTALSIDGFSKTFSVAALVLSAFVGPRPAGKEACHDDGQPSNNSLGNLYWGTHAENMADMVRHGRTQRGEAQWQAVLTEAGVHHIRASRKSPQALASHYGVTEGCIRHVLNRTSWDHVT